MIKIRRPPAKRNPRIFDGKHITVTFSAETGQIRLNFKAVHAGPDFDHKTFAIDVMNEILKAFEGLVEE